MLGHPAQGDAVPALPWGSSRPRGAVVELYKQNHDRAAGWSQRGQSLKLLLIMLPDGSDRSLGTPWPWLGPHGGWFSLPTALLAHLQPGGYS